MVEMQTVVRFYSPWSKPGILLGCFVGVMLSMSFDDKLRELLVVMGATFFPFALDIQLHLARLLEIVRKTATTPIGRAQAGYVELAGRAEGVNGQLLHSPKSDTPCVWHRIEWGGKIKRSRASCSPFLLRDETGHCLIDVDEATVFGTRPPRFSFWDSSGVDEWVILPGDPVYAMGKLAKISAAEAPRVRNMDDIRRAEEDCKDMPGRDAASPIDRAYTLARADQMAQYRNEDKEANEEKWKARQAAARAEKPRPPDMLARWQRNAAAFLKLFDVNRDGRVDLKEMVAARARAAEFEKAYATRANATLETSVPAVQETPADTGFKIWILSKPTEPALPFLILNRKPEDVERYLALRLWTARATALTALAAVPVALFWMK